MFNEPVTDIYESDCDYNYIHLDEHYCLANFTKINSLGSKNNITEDAKREYSLDDFIYLCKAKDFMLNYKNYNVLDTLNSFEDLENKGRQEQANIIASLVDSINITDKTQERDFIAAITWTVAYSDKQHEKVLSTFLSNEITKDWENRDSFALVFSELDEEYQESLLDRVTKYSSIKIEQFQKQLLDADIFADDYYKKQFQKVFEKVIKINKLSRVKKGFATKERNKSKYKGASPSQTKD